MRGQWAEAVASGQQPPRVLHEPSAPGRRGADFVGGLLVAPAFSLGRDGCEHWLFLQDADGRHVRGVRGHWPHRPGGAGGAQVNGPALAGAPCGEHGSGRASWALTGLESLLLSRETTVPLSLPRKAREKMVDPSRTVGNGFTYHENPSSPKLTSVLEAVAGEYALVINGHSLVSDAILSLGSVFPESTSLRMAFMSYWFWFPSTSGGCAGL